MVRSVGVPAAGARARHGGRSLALAVLCTLLFLTFLDNTIVSVALGSVQATCTRASCAAVGGRRVRADVRQRDAGLRDGRRRVRPQEGHAVGAGVFCAGSVLCALAPELGVLIAGRAVMGLGAAASEPGTLSMLRHLYTDERSPDPGPRRLGRRVRGSRSRPSARSLGGALGRPSLETGARSSGST